MKQPRVLGVAATMLVLLGMVPVAGAQHTPVKPQPNAVGTPQADATISNSFVTSAASFSAFDIETTGGDLAVIGDEDKTLLFGNGGTSETTIRVISAAATTDYALNNLVPTLGPTLTAGNRIVTIWELPGGVQVTRELSFLTNPYSGREDQIQITVTTRNTSTAALNIGVRVMLDVMVGNNDAAPYFVPGVGNSKLQQEFLAPNIPAFYTSFEDDAYGAASLKGQGLLINPALTTPDRFVIANWGTSRNVPWEYTVTPQTEHFDSATLMYWNPVAHAPGASRRVATSYGLSGGGGGAQFSDTPVLLPIGTRGFVITIWVNNVSTTPWVNGNITLTLPPGLVLNQTPQRTAQGQPLATTLTQPLGTLQPGQVKQTQWPVTVADPATRRVYEYTGTSTFTSGTPPLVTKNLVSINNLFRLYNPLLRN